MGTDEVSGSDPDGLDGDCWVSSGEAPDYHTDLDWYQPRIEVAREVLSEAPGARSPLMLFDLDALTGQVDLWRRCLEGVTPHFAIKSCDAPGVLEHFHSLGLSFDAATAGEIVRLERIGVPPGRVICTHPIRDEEDLVAIRRFRPRALVVDRLSELRKLEAAGIPGADYAPELIVRIELPYGGLSNKFGAQIAEMPSDSSVGGWTVTARRVRRILDEARAVGERRGFGFGRLGLSSHVGTNTYRTHKYELMLEVFSHLRRLLSKRGHRIEIFNLGGGYCDPQVPPGGAAGQEAFLRDLGEFIQGFQLEHPGVELIGEPGRFLVSNSASLVVGVMGVERRELFARDDNTFQRIEHLNVQMNDGLYGNLLGERHDDKTWRFLAFRSDGDGDPLANELSPAILNGKTCDSWDQMLRKRPLPMNLRAGDQLLVPHAGAYTVVTSTEFNSVPRAQLAYYRRDDEGALVHHLFDARGEPVSAASAEFAGPPVESGPLANSGPDPESYSEFSRVSARATLSQIARGIGEGEHLNLARPRLSTATEDWRPLLDLVALNETSLESSSFLPIAEGGMGWVLRMEQSGLERPLALKIGKTPARGPERDRFQAEARKTADLKDDPRIPAIYRFGVLPEGGYPYYTMEWIEGRTFGERIAECHTEVGLEEGGSEWRKGERRRALGWLRDTAQALQFAHDRGVVHRDVKPANLMIPEDRRLPVKVIDWGLFKARQAPMGRDASGESDPAGDPTVGGGSRAGDRIGTVDYMSPEQARGEEATEASDIWALGACLYRLLTDRRPLEHHGSFDSRIAALCSDRDPIRPIRSLVPDCPSELAEIAHKALRPEPSDRYGSVEELGEELDRYLGRRPVGSYQETLSGGRLSVLGYRVSRAVQRRPRVTLALFGSLALVLLLTVTFALHFARARRSEAAERHVADSALGTLEDLSLDVFATLDGKTAKSFLDRAVVGSHGPQVAERVQVRLDRLFGAMYLQLGYLKEAKPLIERAWAWGVLGVDPRSERRAEQLESYSDVLHGTGQYEKAIAQMGEAHSIYREIHGPRGPESLRALAKLARLHAPVDGARGLELLSEAREASDETLGPGDPLSRLLQLDLGEALLAAGDLEGAVAVLPPSLEELLGAHGELPRSALRAMLLWGSVLVAQGDHDGQVALLERAEALARREFGDRSPVTAMTQSHLATSYERVGRYPDAVGIQRRLLSYAEYLYEDPHNPNRVAALNNLGLFESRVGEYGAAHGHFAAAYAGRLETHGPDGVPVAQVLHNWGTNDSLAGRGDDAERRLREAVRIYASAAGPPTADGMGARRTLGAHLRNYGNYSDAEPYLLGALEESVAIHGEQHPGTWRTLRGVIELYAKWGRSDEAIRFAERYLDSSAADPEEAERARQLLEGLGAEGR